MTAQSVLAKGHYPDFNFRNSSDGTDSEVGGASISGHVSMFVDSASPAVIRFTHNTGPTSAQGLCTVSRSHLFDIAASGLETTANTEASTSHYRTDGANTASFVGEQNAKKTTISVKRPNSRTGISLQANSNKVVVQDLHSLLTSDDNRRPSSRLSVASRENAVASRENAGDGSLKNYYDVNRSETADTNKSHHTVSSGIGDDLENESNTESNNTKENLNQNTYAQITRKKNLAKKVKKKKKNKLSQSAKARTRLQSSNKLIHYGKMKIPVATHVKSDKGITRPNQIGTINQLSNLSDVLQAQCKRITLLKHDSSNREGCKSLDYKTGRQGVNSDTYSRNITRIQTAKSCSSPYGNRNSDVRQSHDLSLPQVASAFVVKSPPAIAKTDNSSSPKSFLMPNYNTRALYGASPTQENTKTVKVYLSEKHSGTLKDCGMEFPCAPPVTPTPDPLRKVEYIPSMNDIRAQRAVKIKLQVLEKEASRKLERQKEEKAKQEKLLQKDREKELKMKQRNEIYALNKIMTELENNRFKEFCTKKGISIGS